MANRPVFIPIKRRPYYEMVGVDFSFNPGFSVAQKQKNIIALHEAYRKGQDGEILEISSKSLQPEGVALSAFNLQTFIPSLNCRVPVECVYQGSKVFEHGGPYTDLYLKAPREAKKDLRLQHSGQLIAFCYEGENSDAYPVTCFYDWLYIRALKENPDIAQHILRYNAFTDIEFNPKKSTNCQARAAAIYLYLHKSGITACVDRFNDFKALFLQGTERNGN